MIAAAPPEAFPMLSFIEIALVIFFAVFVIVSLVTFLRGKGHFDAAARIPLEDAE